MSPKVDQAYKEQRRKEILEAAKRVFLERGFEPATMKDVVEASGMSRGFVYSYFGSTEEMFRAIMDGFDEGNPDPAALFEAHDHAWDVIEALLCPERMPRDEMLFVIYEYFTGGWRHPERRVYLSERYERTVAFYTSVLERGVERGDFDPVASTGEIAQTLLSFVEGLTMSTVQLDGGAGVRPDAQFAVMKTSLRALLRPQGR
ncbi:TetR family transcriptional regulator [Paenibacillus sp. TRM 82003]|nr:TetR family transcriptional regulator [Paenibacillus sp. TRM 82003]